MKKFGRKRRVNRFRVVLEATGIYSLAVSLFLAEREEMEIHVLNPAQARYYAQSRLSRSKTDPCDARLLAELAVRYDDLPRWEPPSDLQLELKSLITRRDNLTGRMTALKSQEHAMSVNPKPHPQLKRSLKREHSFIEKELARVEKLIEDLVDSDPTWKEARKNLESIPGVGPKTSTTVLSIMGHDPSNRSVKAWVASSGLDTLHYQSGTSVYKKPRISKKGNANLRRILYMAALSASKHNPVIKQFYERLLDQGKIKKVALVACSRKLLHMIYGVLKNRMVFDQNYELKAA